MGLRVRGRRHDGAARRSRYLGTCRRGAGRREVAAAAAAPQRQVRTGRLAAAGGFPLLLRPPPPPSASSPPLCAPLPPTPPARGGRRRRRPRWPVLPLRAVAGLGRPGRAPRAETPGWALGQGWLGDGGEDASPAPLASRADPSPSPRRRGRPAAVFPARGRERSSASGARPGGLGGDAGAAARSPQRRLASPRRALTELARPRRLKCNMASPAAGPPWASSV